MMIPRKRTQMFVVSMAGAVVTSALAISPTFSQANANEPTDPNLLVGEAPNANEAQAAARASGERVEDLSRRDEYTAVYAEPDGTWTAESSPEPVRAKNGAGDWAPIDKTLVERAGRLHPRNVPAELSLSTGSDRAFATMQPDPGLDTTAGTMSWEWPSDLPTPRVDGATATYADVSPNADLVVTATATGFTHNIVLREPPAADAPALKLVVPVATPGAELRETADGALVVNSKDTGHETLAAAPAPLMWDASGDPSATGTGTGTGRNGPEDPAVVLVDAAVTDTAAGGTLVLRPDPDFLSDPDTVYPVTIDPSLSRAAEADTWVMNEGYTASQSTSVELRAGTYDGGAHIARTFMKFPGISVWGGKEIRGASLVMRNFSSTSCNAGAVRVERVTEAWSTTGITWQNQPPATSMNYGQYSGAHGFDSSCPQADAAFSMTEMVRDWAEHGLPNKPDAPFYGVRLSAYSETNSNSWRRYRSTEYSTESYHPVLTVNYNTFPSAPSTASLTVTPCIGNCDFEDPISDSLTPTLGAKATDHDNGPLSFNWEVRNASSLDVVASGSTSGTSGAQESWTVPSGALEAGVLYEFRSGASDHTSPVQWSPWKELIVVPDAPPAVPADLGVTPCPTDDCASAVTTSLTPVLAATVDDVDSPIVVSKFEVRDGAGVIKAAGDAKEVAPGGNVSFEVPAGALQNSTQYEFRVAADDGKSTTRSPWESFTVSAPAPDEYPAELELTTCLGPCDRWESSGEGATFSASVSSGAPTAGVTVKFEVRSGDFTATGDTPAVLPGKAATWTLPAGTVSSGEHVVRAGIVDGADVHWTGWQPFTTTVPLDTTHDTPLAEQAAAEDGEVLDPPAPPTPVEVQEDEGSPDPDPYSESDLAALEEEIDSDRARARAQGLEEDSTSVVGRSVPAPVKYAPVMYLHHKEDRWPLSASTFIGYADLYFAHAGLCSDHVDARNPKESYLGDGVYRHQGYSGPCRDHGGTYYHSNGHGVHPYKDGGPGWGTGFNLNIPNSVRDGQGFQKTEPVYYNYVAKSYIEYWFHYGESSVPNTGPNLGKHEGDWEHIEIKLSSVTNQPLWVKYYYHKDSCKLPWRDVPKANTTHPLLNVALNSHGNYPPGYLRENTGGSWGWWDQLSSTGKVWYANKNLQFAPNRAWYGYTGAWGEVKDIPVNTGPWGPNPERESGPGSLKGIERCGTGKNAR